MSLLHFLDSAELRRRTTQPYGRIMALVTPLLTLTFVISLVSFQLLHFTFVEARTPGSRSASISGTLTPRIAQSHLDKAADPHQRLELAIGLKLRNQVELEHALQSTLAPVWSMPRQFITTEQYSKRFSPTETTYTLLQRFLEHGGLRITQTYNHRLLFEATGTVAQVEQLLHVKINMYTDRDGHSYYANNNEPVLPGGLASQVLSISGLNNATHWYHELYSTHGSAGKANAQSMNCPPSDRNDLSPNQFARAYHLDSLYRSGNRGEGQGIALFELSTWQRSDLDAYTACFGHSRTPIQILKTGSPPLNDEGETDAELVLGAAPQLDTLKVYETANNESSYLSQWAQIIQDAPAVVASNWSQCEMNVTPQVIQQEHLFFQLAALQRQTILAAAGAPGNAACSGDSNSTPISTGVVDPAAQPFVTAVGGTALTLNQNSYGYETTWNEKAAGGGISRYWTLPDWQHMVGVPDPVYSSTVPCAPSTGHSGKYCREVPDVALNADLDHGYWVYCKNGEGCDRNKPWVVTGGTAAATSLWAVLAALTNELYAREEGSRIGFLNPLLYRIAADPVKYASNFHHVVVETDEIGRHSGPRYPATIGYNMATGLGSYNALLLTTNLIKLAQEQATGYAQHKGKYVISLQRRP
ncbi:MAG: S53 family peptidase [Ktedonobacteraceae bacterium]|nr:S53 family peptidase [Ktedonobacteraceae bacterium]